MYSGLDILTIQLSYMKSLYIKAILIIACSELIYTKWLEISQCIAIVCEMTLQEKTQPVRSRIRLTH